ncbi:MAG TPA: hypothetical protein VN612_01980 [Acidobacteriaceae bacterium]|nr:hypothetical protein [Acidobacteriaceae bacterium]
MGAPTNLSLVPSKPEMIEILKGTLEDVEHEPSLNPKDPKVIDWKQSIRRSIAELESDCGKAA